ncbi:MAG: transcription-repair coupling factor [Planctomycetes bacterium]|nr:transcription-repair coupling factor [Planctomycetota bacterium]
MSVRADAPRELAKELASAGFPDFERLLAAVGARQHVGAGNLWGSAQALVLALLAERAQGPWIAVTASDAEAEAFVDDLEAFGARATWLPARDPHGKGGTAHADLDLVRRRLQVAQQVGGPPERRPRLVVASLLSLLQPLPSPGDLERDYLGLQAGQKLDAEGLLERLVSAGYARQPLAERPGEVSLRGEILDLYPFAAELPLRIELFGDEIESLRTFDPLDQRSVESVKQVQVCLATDAGGVEDGDGVLLSSLASPTTTFVEIEPLRVEDKAGGLRIQSPAHAQALLEFGRTLERRRRIDLQSLPAKDVNFDTRSVQSLAVGMREAARALREATLDESHALVLCQNEAEEHRFRALLAEAGSVERVETRVGSIAKGFRIPALRLVVLNHRELAGILGRRAAPKAAAHYRVRALQSFFELKPGDLVVHAVHGLARFHGLKRMERAGGEEDHLHLLFADEVSLFVPVSRIDMVQRYVGSGSLSPPLDKIGSQSFRKRKEKVERALFDLATELLEVQAKRALRTRPAWPGDDEIVRDMIGAFPYVDTPDQKTVDAEIRADLSSDKPMDRLLCGDVGFGKTELAVRAAFRVVNGGGQVAVLVPTTVLAEQHYETFKERMADFPVEVAELSRYVTGKDAREVLTKVELGEVDIVIGTHRILSSDVRFKNLGLVIVDEEQRFGVQHKEHFKKLRAQVDLLTLTATPIPRTLHMSISGVRDISALTIPPDGRQEIDTVLGYVEDEEQIREALLFEKNRGGQVFFLHNRVESIQQTALRLSRLVPECSYAIGHGQMGARELKKVMDAFTHGEVDVLVATTIIESGIDIPSAGTIVIDHADHFGLAELHQLRGRVGRGKHKAWCYLLVEKWKPLKQDAKERLKALEEMRQLGAGFQISMKDLEIRGAGNILGPQQSGHIGAIGYDMYCRLLKQTIDKLQDGQTLEQITESKDEEGGAELELGLRAYLPEEWIPDGKARLEVLRQLSTIRNEEDRARAHDMLRDRFGRVPDPANDLLLLFRLKAQLEELSIKRLAWRKDVYLLEYGDRVALEQGLDLRLAELRPLRTGIAHLVIPTKHTTARAALAWFEGLLKAGAEAGRMRATGRR